MDPIPIAALVGEDCGSKATADVRARLARADVIIGVDTTTQREFTVFGTPALEESFVAGRPVALHTVRVELDQRSGQLDELVALVRTIKARHGYAVPDE